MSFPNETLKCAGRPSAIFDRVRPFDTLRQARGLGSRHHKLGDQGEGENLPLM